MFGKSYYNWFYVFIADKRTLFSSNNGHIPKTSIFYLIYSYQYYISKCFANC